MPSSQLAQSLFAETVSLPFLLTLTEDLKSQRKQLLPYSEVEGALEVKLRGLSLDFSLGSLVKVALHLQAWFLQL